MSISTQINVYNPNSRQPGLADFTVTANPKAAFSAVKLFDASVRDAGMQYNYCVALGETAKLASKVMSAAGVDGSAPVMDFAKSVKSCTEVSSLFRLAQLVYDLYEAGGNWALGATRRVHIKAVDTIAELGAMVVYSAAFVTKNCALLPAAAVPSLVHDSAGAYVAVSDLVDISNEIERQKGAGTYSGRIQKCLDDTKFHAIVSAVKPVLKTIASVASLLAVGCASFALSAEVTLGIALVASYSAIAAYFLKEGSAETLLSYNKLPVIV